VNEAIAHTGYHLEKVPFHQTVRSLGTQVWDLVPNDPNSDLPLLAIKGALSSIRIEDWPEEVEAIKRGYGSNPVKIRPEFSYDPQELAAGVIVEREHTDSPSKASRIARQHLEETPDYYTRLDAAGLADNPPQFLDKMSFNTKGIIVDGKLMAWEVDERGNPHHLDVGKKLGIDTSKTTQITFERYVTGNGYVETSLGIILKGGLYSKDEAIQEARGLIENYVGDLDGLDDTEVLWSDHAGGHRWQGRSRELGVTAANPPSVYRVHFFDIWHGRRDFRETTAETVARARANVRARLAEERGLHPSQLPSNQYEFGQVERIG
jgi:hypothetical protein